MLNNQEANKPLPKQQFNYNEFIPSLGVTLYFNNNIKEGPKHLENIETL